ncbi:MAG: DPP IV N-terminal domain-containing protein, partial [Caulobacteraceae bacterium]
MRLFVSVLSLAAAIAVSAAAKPAEGPSRTFEGKDIFALQWAEDPEVRPDGGAIAYVRSAYEIMTDKARHSIWLADPSTGAQTPLVAGPGSQSHPRWSPDGKRLAYVSTSEDGRPQLYVRWMAGGQSARIAELPEAPGSIAWSPDGRFIAFSMFVRDDGEVLGQPMKKPEGAEWAEPLKVITRLHYREDQEGYLKPGYQHLFLVPADGGAPRQLTFGAYDDGGPISWSKDGKALYFGANRRPGWEREPLNTEVFRLEVADGTLTPLTSRFGPDEQPQLSPDGRTLAYVGFDDKFRGYENARLYVMDASGGSARSLS